MYNDHKKWWMFPGRWQPLHKGHMAIIQQKLDEGKNIWVAVRDTEISEGNPYTAEQRVEMVKRAYKELYGTRVIASIIPDIEGIAYGRGVGYAIEELDVAEAVKQISATKVRNGEVDHMCSQIQDYTTLLKTTVWFTGLPCSGKTTICKALKDELANRGFAVSHLDGDDVRKGLCKDLGFSPEDRAENMRRISTTAELFNNSGMTVLASFVSPTEAHRAIVKENITNLKVIHVQASADKCAERDVKGMWAKAKAGEIPEFTGVSAPFEEPVDPFMTVDTENKTVDECVQEILTALNA